MGDAVPVLHYARYLSPSGHSVYGYVNFCSACRKALCGKHGSAYTFPYSPEDLEVENDRLITSFSSADDGDIEFFSFCPWCGTKLADQWWRDQIIRNERVMDHYDRPGTHGGDMHEFVGAIQGHYLGSSDPELICWCEPEVTAGLLGCTIRHMVLPPPERMFQEVA